MIEASGEDQNGGIFTASVDYSVLECQPKSVKINLKKKFGDWDEQIENYLKFPLCRKSGSNGVYIGSSLVCTRTYILIKIQPPYLQDKSTRIIHLPAFNM